MVLDRLRSGEYMVGICTGSSDSDLDLVSELIMEEQMVIIPSALKRFKYQVGDVLEVITIESRSGAWASIEEAMQNLNLRRISSMESFFSVAQMAIAGFGHGLPLSRLNTRYFGGDLNVMSLDGYGTDVYITLNKQKFRPISLHLLILMLY